MEQIEKNVEKQYRLYHEITKKYQAKPISNWY
jgi:hypothetical protein